MNKKLIFKISEDWEVLLFFNGEQVEEIYNGHTVPHNVWLDLIKRLSDIEYTDEFLTNEEMKEWEK